MARQPFMQFSLAKLLGAVFVFAAGLGGLLNAMPLVADLFFNTGIFVLGAAVLGIAYRRERQRAFWVGFLAFGAIYFSLWSTNFLAEIGPFEKHQGHLATNRLLAYLHENLASTGRPKGVAGADLRVYGDKLVLDGHEVQPDLLLTAVFDRFKATGYDTILRSGDLREASPAVRSAIDKLQRHRRVNIVQGDLVPVWTDFQRVGHSLFTLLFALVGGLVAQWFHATRRPLQPA